ncbi:MAG TPA: HD domain-containing protein [Rectinema sp.]|jgi:HD superfamily phosphohydrolase YqeK|nr:HD domain-containing protein [Rectinema sp.]
MLDEIESKLQGKVRYYKSTIHGISHLRAVSLLAGELAPPEFKKAAMIAGFLHDIGRKNDFGGRQHAVDSAIIARPLITSIWPEVDIEKICYAIEHHADGLTTDDPLIGAIWDADRITLSRLGRKINTSLLSTEAAKKATALLDTIVRKIIQDGHMTVIDRLQFCADNGFLLHGSPKKGLSYLRGNGDEPLFATQIPLYAMMYATTPTLHDKVSIWDADFFYAEWWPPLNPTLTIRATPILIQNLADGSVYVLESAKFERAKLGVEFKTHDQLPPIATIDICPFDVISFIKPLTSTEIKMLRENADATFRNNPPSGWSLV